MRIIPIEPHFIWIVQLAIPEKVPDVPGNTGKYLNNPSESPETEFNCLPPAYLGKQGIS